jgi:hypothetical protein
MSRCFWLRVYFRTISRYRLNICHNHHLAPRDLNLLHLFTQHTALFRYCLRGFVSVDVKSGKKVSDDFGGANLIALDTRPPSLFREL